MSTLRDLKPSAACRCRRRVDVAVGGGRMQPERLQFVERSTVQDAKLQIQDLHDVAALFRSAGAFDSPADLTTQVLRVLDTNPGPLLN